MAKAKSTTPKSILPEAGDVFEHQYPFVREDYSYCDEDGTASIPSWKPGVRFEHIPPGGDTETLADGLGAQILTVIGTYKPGRFPLRVFFTRQWHDPDGKLFGKGACKATTINAWRSLVAGYRHQYELIGGAQ